MSMQNNTAILAVHITPIGHRKKANVKAGQVLNTSEDWDHKDSWSNNFERMGSSNQSPSFMISLTLFRAISTVLTLERVKELWTISRNFDQKVSTPNDDWDPNQIHPSPSDMTMCQPYDRLVISSVWTS